MPEIDKETIAEICEKRSVKMMALFGSITTGDFTDSSDVDVLISFDDRGQNLFDVYFDLKNDLEHYFHRPVDLVVEKEFRNKYFRESLASSKVIVYERDRKLSFKN